MIKTISQTLVVGASGRVGRLLTRAWIGAGQNPVLQHRGTALQYGGPQLMWDPLASGGQGTSPLGRGGLFRAMVVLAGTTPGRGDLALNAALAEACFRAADAAGIPQILLASSSAVYGVSAGAPFHETDPLCPVNDYGRAKVAAELVADAWRGRGLSVTVLRIGNVAGADALLTNAARPLSIDCFDDGAGPLRSYIGPQSMAQVISGLVGRDLPPVLNFAAPRPVAMSDLASSANLPWGFVAAPSTAHQNITMNCDTLNRILPFGAKESTAKGIVAQLQALVEPV